MTELLTAEQLMSAPITLSFTHVENEYVAATRWFYARVYHTRFLLIISCIVLSLGLVLILLSSDFIFGSVALVVGLILFVFNFYAYFVMPSQYFRRNTKFREQYTLQFTEDGLRFHSRGVESKLAWDFYSKVLETPQFYLLCYDKDLFTLIPKRAFGGKEQEGAFRDLLNRKTGANLDTQEFVAGSTEAFSPGLLPPQGPPDWR
jgi:hypothetical protein